MFLLREQDHAESPEAVTLEEYADFACPFCAKAAVMMPRLQRRFGGRLKYVFKHFPLPDVHPFSTKLAEAAEAAGAQGKFRQMHDLLFRNPLLHTESGLIQLADAIELDVGRFKQELSDGTYSETVREEMAQGRAAGVLQTPAFIVASFHR